MIPLTLNQLVQLNDFVTIGVHSAEYAEFIQWQSALCNGTRYAIRESILNAVYECEKSAFSIVIEQAIFLADAQKTLLKREFAQECSTCLENLKHDLHMNGLLLKS